MKKIISFFKRDYNGTRQVYDEIVQGSEWVVNGEGIATLKIDGTCCMVRDGKLYKRYDAKKDKKPPSNFEPAQDESDPVTGHWPGWVPVTDTSDDKWHNEAWKHLDLEDGTYELIGPKVQGNPYGLNEHRLRKHGDEILADVPRTFEGLKEFFKTHEIEGIVWHRENGDMVKIKRRDFGFKWPVT